jgi:hypothetical protein
MNGALASAKQIFDLSILKVLEKGSQGGYRPEVDLANSRFRQPKRVCDIEEPHILIVIHG